LGSSELRGAQAGAESTWLEFPNSKAMIQRSLTKPESWAFPFSSWVNKPYPDEDEADMPTDGIYWD
jgi:hypothetical protein